MYFYPLLIKAIVQAIQMSTHNIIFYKENQKNVAQDH